MRQAERTRLSRIERAARQEEQRERRRAQHAANVEAAAAFYTKHTTAAGAGRWLEALHLLRRAAAVLPSEQMYARELQHLDRELRWHIRFDSLLIPIRRLRQATGEISLSVVRQNYILT